VQSQVSTRTGGCAALTPGYLLEPLCGESQQALPEFEKCNAILLCEVAHFISGRARKQGESLLPRKSYHMKNAPEAITLQGHQLER
jgi:hypothetical protein